ncbi:hypothetical protein MKW92_020126 [Papaver armeniacum]|nr:hypothetical protein MKW92_020126 [Papaver armeniacum]
MASSSSLAFTIIFICFQVVNSLVNTSSVNKVEVSLYYDSLHPESAKFITKFLPTIFDENLTDIANLNLVPYGKAKLDGIKNEVTCERGRGECFLNKVQACAIHIWPEEEKHSYFVFCVESFVAAEFGYDWSRCFDFMAEDKTDVVNCYLSGDFGKKLELHYAMKTSRVIPRIQTLPWVTVNGVPLYNGYRNFKNIICQAYKGRQPEICQKKV